MWLYYLDLHPFPTRRSSDLHLPFLGKATEKVECLPVLCRMCDNDKFKAGIGGFLIKAPDTTPQGIALTVTHDDERNERGRLRDRKSTRLNSSHLGISYAVFC